MKINYELGLMSMRYNHIIKVYDLFTCDLLYMINYENHYNNYYMVCRFFGSLSSDNYELMEIGWML
jgi:hypothetical protein